MFKHKVINVFLVLFFLIVMNFIFYDKAFAVSNKTANFDTGILNTSTTTISVYGSNISSVKTATSNTSYSGGTVIATVDSTTQISLFFYGGRPVDSTLYSKDVSGLLNNSYSEGNYSSVSYASTSYGGDSMSPLTPYQGVVGSRTISRYGDYTYYEEGKNNKTKYESSSGYSSTYYYNKDGYVGTLNRTGAPVYISGSKTTEHTEVASHHVTPMTKDKRYYSSGSFLDNLTYKELDAYSYLVSYCTSKAFPRGDSGVGTDIQGYLNGQVYGIYTYKINTPNYGQYFEWYTLTHNRNLDFSNAKYLYSSTPPSSFYTLVTDKSCSTTTSPYGRFVQLNTVPFDKIYTVSASDNTVYYQYYTGTADKIGTLYSGKIYFETDFKYRYVGSVEYVSNIAPTLTNIDIPTGIYSYTTGKNSFEITGTASDVDGDVLKVMYAIDNGVNRVLVDSVPANSNFTGTVNVKDLGLSDNNHTIRVWITDGAGNSYAEIGNFEVDITPPETTFLYNPSTYTQGNVTIDALTKATDNRSGVSSVSPSIFVATENGSYPFTLVDNLGNSTVLNAVVNKIDRTSPIIKLTSNSDLNWIKTRSVKIDITDNQSDGDLTGSGIKDASYQWTQSSEFPSDGTWTPLTISGKVVSQTVNSPSNVNGEWYLHVKTSDNVGLTDTHSSGIYRLDNTAPEKGNLTLELNGVGSIKATINNATDSLAGLNPSNSYSFRLDNGSWTTPGGNSYTFSGLQGNREYKVSYKVYDNTEGTHENKNVVEDSIGSKIITMSNHPSSLETSNLTTNSLVFNIIENNNLNGGTTSGSKYTLYAKDTLDNLVGLPSSKSTNLTDRSISSLETNTPYVIYSKVENQDGIETTPDNRNTIKVLNSSVSVNQVYTSAEVPGLKLVNASSNSQELLIDKKSNPSWTDYYVEFSTSPTFASSNSVVLGNNWTTTLNVNKNGLSPGNDYYYRVKARNGDKIETSWSPIYNFKSVSSAPVLTSVTVDTHEPSKSQTGLVVKWNSVNGAEKYYIYRDSVKVGEVNSSTLQFIDYVDMYNKAYTYTVRAWNGLGSSADDTEMHDIGISAVSNSIIRTARAHDALALDLVSINGTVAYFDINNSENNSVSPSYYFEVRRKGSTTVVATSTWDKKLKDRTVSGLSYGVAYEIWVNVRNEENVTNGLIKLVDEFWMNRTPEINLYLEDNHTSIYKDFDVIMNDSKINKSGYVPNDKYAVYSDVSNYNFIRLRGEIKDLDILPTNEPLKLTYTIKDKTGRVVNGHSNVSIAQLGDIIGDKNGAWTELKYNNNLGKYLGLSSPRFNSSISNYDGKSYKLNDYINIPIDNRLADGEYSIEVTLIDDQDASAVGKALFKVDRTVGNGKLESSNKSYSSIDLNILDDTFDIAGKDNNPYSIEVSENNLNKFNSLFNYKDTKEFTHKLNEKTESNTKFTYRALLKDKGGNVYKTNLIEYISSLKLKDEKYKDENGNPVRYNPERPNSFEIEWENPLEKSDGLTIEIYRSNKLITLVNEGNTYIDKNLDYERDYNYKIIVVGKDKDGNRLESLPIEFKLTTGAPLLITEIPPEYKFDLTLNAYNISRPIFTKDVKLSLDVEYKQGATAEISYLSSINKYSDSFIYTLKPHIKNRINFIGKGDDKEFIDVSVLLTDVNLEDGISSKTKFAVNEVIPNIIPIDEDSINQNLINVLYN